MKRFSFLSMVLLLVVLVGAETQARTFYFGVKAGTQRANVYDKDSDYWDPVTGYHGGLFVTYTFLDSLQIRSEFSYTTRGTEVNESGISGNIRADYLEFALLGLLIPSDNSRLRVLVGPSFAKYLGGVYDFTVDVNGFPFSGEDNLASDDLNPWDVGLIFGMDYIRSNVVIDVRYQWGLTKIINQDTHPENTFNLQHRVLEFGLGYRF